MALGDIICTNPGPVSQEPASNTVPLTTLTVIVRRTQDTTAALQRRITELYDRERNFQKSTLARIATAMTEFGQLISNTEQILDTINPPEQNHLYAMHTKVIAKNKKQTTKYRE